MFFDFGTFDFDPGYGDGGTVIVLTPDSDITDGSWTTGGSTATWDPAQLGASVTLSNGNLSAECTGTVVNQITKAAVFQSTGKFYFEFTIDNALDNSVVGIANAAADLTEYIGQNGARSAGIFNGIWLGTSGSAPPFVTGHVYGIAVDLINKRAWAKDITAAGDWNAISGGDPVGNVWGADISAITGDIYPACSLIHANDKITVNFGATAYAGTPPAGYGNWATAGALYASIDEYPADDADYIRSSGNPSNDTCEVGLSNPPAGLADPFHVSYRYRGSVAGVLDLRVRLKEGSNVIATWTHSTIGDTFVTQVQTLSAPEIASIINPGNLSIELMADS